MSEPLKPTGPKGDRVRFVSDCEILEVREEDTSPGRGLSESSRKWLEKKYGRKPPPPKSGEPQ